jgi:hypothetical protein
MVESIYEVKFIYDCCFGLMPRRFDYADDEDKIIYDEEEEVSEIYFMTDGTIGIAFSLISNGINKKQYHIGLKLHASDKHSTIICDHYVVNKCKS